MNPTVADIPPKSLESAKRQFVELYGSALVMNTYLKIAVVLLALVALALVEDGLAKVVLQEFGVDAARCRAEIRKVLPEKLVQGDVRCPDRFVPQPRPSFEGEGRCIRQNADENVYGHVCLRLILVGRIEPPPPMRVIFAVTEKNLPNNQWAAIQYAIQGWWNENRSAFGQWLVVVDIIDASWCEGAMPAFDRAAVAALKDAVSKATAAGLLPGA